MGITFAGSTLTKVANNDQAVLRSFEGICSSNSCNDKKKFEFYQGWKFKNQVIENPTEKYSVQDQNLQK